MKTLMVSHLLPLLGRGRDPRAQRYRGARESSGGAEPCAARSPVTKGQLSTCSASPPDLPVVPGSESHSRNGNSVASAPDLQLKRHGLAVCLALTTMCTSLLLVYSSLGGQKERPPQQQQQQAAATGSAQPSAESSSPSRPGAPAGPRPLDGYLGVADHKPLRMHCRDCALVTSSGHLLHSQQGPQIDQTECVIRMNDAPTRGFGRDVGNRTSLRVIAHSSIQRILRNRHDLLNVSQGTVFIFWGPSSYMRRDGKGQVYNNLQLLSQVLPRLKAFMITRHKMLQFDELFKQETGKDRKISNTWLSTGWFTMTIALELCDRIDVYGMVPPDFCRICSS
ncbi:alpha-N-acetylgalactosaminide alpha-2,6-sialyltransferase 5 isoform X3 [Manis javanica]|uniref:alpha-N-acetylgalactosaminide alpha-2,6-sialyltransferase 5 isoform X3 n=1 Tax=Manis javanica TaxID=9974 RepID=UPI003C6D286B